MHSVNSWLVNVEAMLAVPHFTDERIGTQRGGDTCLDSCSCWAEKVEFIFLQNCALNHWTLLGPQNRTWPPVSFSSRPVSLQSSHGTGVL